jgi:hypothetical protein
MIRCSVVVNPDRNDTGPVEEGGAATVKWYTEKTNDGGDGSWN